MSDALEKTGSPVGVPERRRHARQQVSSLAYVDMGEENGGLLIDISENGFAVQTAVGLIGDRLPQMRFQLPGSENWIEAGGRLAWTGNSLKEAGVEFVDLPEGGRNQIRGWISSQASPGKYQAASETFFEEGELRSGRPVAPDSTSAIPKSSRTRVVLEKATRDSTSSANVATARPVGRQSNRPIREPTAPDMSEKKYTPSSISPINTAKSLGRYAAPVTNLWPAVPLLGPTRTSGLETKWRSAFGRVNPKAERRSWKTLVIMISLLAIMSFAAGAALGPGAFKGMLGSLRLTIWGGSAPGQNEAPPAADTTAEAPPTGVAEEAIRRLQLPTDIVPSSSGDESRKAASRNPVEILETPPSLPSAPTGSIGEEQKSAHLLLNMDTPESASNSVAITTRRSIPTLPGVRVVTPRLEESLQIGELIHRVEPVYPLEAEQERIEGTVKLHAVIGKGGAIRSLQLISGPPLLVPPAMGAVREWRYNPTLFERRPIETEEDISIVFRLPR